MQSVCSDRVVAAELTVSRVQMCSVTRQLQSSGSECSRLVHGLRTLNVSLYGATTPAENTHTNMPVTEHIVMIGNRHVWPE